MSKLEVKLREVKNRKARREFLEELSNQFSALLEKSEYQHNTACLKFAAFTTWDNDRDCETTTRGDIEDWEIHYFYTLIEVIRTVKATIPQTEVSGWFFISTDGPYFSLTLADFILSLDGLSEYCEKNNHYDLGWVGKEQDMGVIIEFNHTSFCRNQLELCTWGL
jgi:hypothetical protein